MELVVESERAANAELLTCDDILSDDGYGGNCHDEGLNFEIAGTLEMAGSLEMEEEKATAEENAMQVVEACDIGLRK